MKIILTAVLFFLVIGFVRAEKLVFSAMQYPPFYASSLDNNGPLIEVIVRAYQKVGYQISVEFAPWARALHSAQLGVTDGMVGLWYSKKRALQFQFSDPIMANQMGFYKRKGDAIEYQHFSELTQQGLILGSVRGYIKVEGLVQSGIKTTLVNSDEQNLKMLSRGRVDLVLVDKNFARYILGKTQMKLFAKNIEWLEPVLEHKQQYLGLSRQKPKSAQRLVDFNRGLALLKGSGEWAAILKKHGF